MRHSAVDRRAARSDDGSGGRCPRLAAQETLTATNPCGEIPLPPYGVCDLGSFNLTAFVASPYAADARLDLDALAESAQLAVRFLDNVIEVSRYPLPAQAALQPFVDNAISKTINVAADIPFERFEDIYRQTHALGLKGCTVFRPNPVTGAILSQPPATEQVRCCSLEREAD